MILLLNIVVLSLIFVIVFLIMIIASFFISRQIAKSIREDRIRAIKDKKWRQKKTDNITIKKIMTEREVKKQDEIKSVTKN